MEFLHRPSAIDDTIAAICTPPGDGAIAVIRISGKQAFPILNRCFSKDISSLTSHTAHFGKLLDKEGKLVDEVLLLLFRAPRSFTGEDVIEIHCHGGHLVTQKVLKTILEAGARAAGPGEFSFRALMNNKLDLSQAEAICQLIRAKNDRFLQAAESHLEGKLSSQIRSFQKRLTHVAAILEAWVDFPEEGLEFASIDDILSQLEKLIEEMQALSQTFNYGKVLQHGISLCLAGPPNAGKSSLMNQLLRKERAIVTPIAGTTRDVLEDGLKIGNLHFQILDTAGIRDTDEVIEQEGIKRSKAAMQKADIVLLVLDLTAFEETHLKFQDIDKERLIIVWNKKDLPHKKPILSETYPYQTFLCAKTGDGIDQLENLILKAASNGEIFENDALIITQERHKQSLDQSIFSTKKAIEGLQSDISPEFLTADIKEALKELGYIIGTNISEDILSEIFSTFCVGK